MAGIHDRPLTHNPAPGSTPDAHPNTPHTMQFIILPPARRINRRRPSHAAQLAHRTAQAIALSAAAYGLAYIITSAALN
jgi:hypothetical protein